MKILIFLLISILSYGQCETDTIVNKYDYLKLKQLSTDCADEINGYITTNSKLESLVRVQEKRIRILEDLLINREKWDIKKCPKLSKKRKPKRRRI